mgnify:FL=1|jgi:uncharacterized damage-inducible protein DinB
MPTAPALRTHVNALLTARQAHCTFDEAVAHMPPARRGEQPDALPYSAWELVAHLRRAQHDLLDYCRTPDYEPPEWPDAYWPEAPAPPRAEAWDEAVAQFKHDRAALSDLVTDETIDLYDTVPASDEHTYLREALLVADHNAYHIGQLVTLRRHLGLWPPSSNDK